jgi:hypothetical protein
MTAQAFTYAESVGLLLVLGFCELLDLYGRSAISQACAQRLNVSDGLTRAMENQ